MFRLRPRKADPERGKRRGSEAEAHARDWLETRGLRCLEQNLTVRGGEIDLVMREQETVVFVEVRQRRSGAHGSAAESVDRRKQARLIFAARHYLARLRPLPPARFDVLAIDGDDIQWIKNAFEVE